MSGDRHGPVAAPAGGFARSVKRSVTIAGHETSISLEPPFWRALDAAATTRGLPLNALVAEIDAMRILDPRPANLASALRSWVLAEALRIRRNIVDYENDSQ